MLFCVLESAMFDVWSSPWISSGLYVIIPTHLRVCPENLGVILVFFSSRRRKYLNLVLGCFQTPSDTWTPSLKQITHLTCVKFHPHINSLSDEWSGWIEKSKHTCTCTSTSPPVPDSDVSSCSGQVLESVAGSRTSAAVTSTRSQPSNTPLFPSTSWFCSPSLDSAWQVGGK